mmetsp:Transcript_87956/g.175940  ORF Transcript_87956/g.175940 Transcript_87956/m.175940 type:complete len:174 (+) Transcript_87956:87-608(+)
MAQGIIPFKARSEELSKTAPSIEAVVCNTGGHSSEWRTVIDSKIGFHETSHNGSNFAKVELLEREAARLKAEKDAVEKRLKSMSSPGKSPALTGKAACIQYQYESTSKRTFVHHEPLEHAGTRICRPSEKERGKERRGKNTGEFVEWLDARGDPELLTQVASSRAGITRMKRV